MDVDRKTLTSSFAKRVGQYTSELADASNNHENGQQIQIRDWTESKKRKNIFQRQEFIKRLLSGIGEHAKLRTPSELNIPLIEDVKGKVRLIIGDWKPQRTQRKHALQEIRHKIFGVSAVSQC